MQTLPNGIKIFNATPHVIRFWHKSWNEPIEVKSDRVVSAKMVEKQVPASHIPNDVLLGMENEPVLVKIVFESTPEGQEVIERAHGAGALVIGSIIAAQAYPGAVLAMTPAPGYERVPPAEKRMNPDKFTVY